MNTEFKDNNITNKSADFFDSTNTNELDHWITSAHYFQFGQHQIAYHDHGKGPALVCLHGFPTSSRDWYKLIPALSQNFRVITFDFLGFGLSDKPLNYHYSITDQADITEALIETLGIEKFHLLSHDYGDTIAQELLSRDKTRFQQDKSSSIIMSCCLLNGGLFPETSQPLLVQKLLASPLGSLLTRLTPFALIKKSLNKTFYFTYSPTPKEWYEIQQLMTYKKGVRVQAQLISYLQQRVNNRSRWVTALCTDHCPILFINGQDDPISGIHMADRYQTLIPKPNIHLISQCGHYPQLEKPAEVLRACLDFYQGST